MVNISDARREESALGETQAVGTVPLIDLASLGARTTGTYDDEPSPMECHLARELVEALSTVGFAALINHGISGASLSALQESSRSFFSLASSEKELISMTCRGRAWRGYFSEGTELTSGSPDQKEGIYFGARHSSDHPLVRKGAPMHGENLWPARPETLQPLVEEHMRSARALAVLSA